MAQRVDDVIQLCCEIAAQPEFKNTLKKIGIGSLLTAAVAGAGALLFGPPGFLFGGAVGGLLAWRTSEQFKSLPQILMELPPAEKQKLYDNIVAVLGNLTWTNTPQLIAMVMGNAALQQRVTDVLLNYIKKSLR